MYWKTFDPKRGVTVGQGPKEFTENQELPGFNEILAEVKAKDFDSEEILLLIRRFERFKERGARNSKSVFGNAFTKILGYPDNLFLEFRSEELPQVESILRRRFEGRIQLPPETEYPPSPAEKRKQREAKERKMLTAFDDVLEVVGKAKFSRREVRVFLEVIARYKAEYEKEYNKTNGTFVIREFERQEHKLADGGVASVEGWNETDCFVESINVVRSLLGLLKRHHLSCSILNLNENVGLDFEEVLQVRDILEHRLNEGDFDPKPKQEESTKQEKVIVQEPTIRERLMQEMEDIVSAATKQETITHEAREIIEESIQRWEREGVAPREIQRRAQLFELRARQVIQEDLR